MSHSLQEKSQPSSWALQINFFKASFLCQKLIWYPSESQDPMEERLTISFATSPLEDLREEAFSTSLANSRRSSMFLLVISTASTALSSTKPDPEVASELTEAAWDWPWRTGLPDSSGCSRFHLLWRPLTKSAVQGVGKKKEKRAPEYKRSELKYRVLQNWCRINYRLISLMFTNIRHLFSCPVVL